MKIGIAYNEYATKFSINRNTVALLSTDAAISALYGSDSIHQIKAYSPYVSYLNGDVVWYKISDTDDKTYLLSSISSPNTSQPTISSIDSFQFVVPDDNWKVCTFEDFSTFDEINLKAYEYSAQFAQSHDAQYHDNVQFSPYSSPYLKIDFSNALYSRSQIFYPQTISKMACSNVSGFYRTWQKSMIDYSFSINIADMSAISNSTTENGDWAYSQRNYNYLYFRKNIDEEDMVRISPVKALDGVRRLTVQFDHEFRDLNYTVFYNAQKILLSDKTSYSIDILYYGESSDGVLTFVVEGRMKE